MGALFIDPLLTARSTTPLVAGMIDCSWLDPLGGQSPGIRITPMEVASARSWQIPAKTPLLAPSWRKLGASVFGEKRDHSRGSSAEGPLLALTLLLTASLVVMSSLIGKTSPPSRAQNGDGDDIDADHLDHNDDALGV